VDGEADVLGDSPIELRRQEEQRDSRIELGLPYDLYNTQMLQAFAYGVEEMEISLHQEH